MIVTHCCVSGVDPGGMGLWSLETLFQVEPQTGESVWRKATDSERSI